MVCLHVILPALCRDMKYVVTLLIPVVWLYKKTWKDFRVMFIGIRPPGPPGRPESAAIGHIILSIFQKTENLSYFFFTFFWKIITPYYDELHTFQRLHFVDSPLFHHFLKCCNPSIFFLGKKKYFWSMMPHFLLFFRFQSTVKAVDMIFYNMTLFSENCQKWRKMAIFFHRNLLFDVPVGCICLYRA